jgi:glycosyltransferase involved in cell wall biosynthesis
LIREFADRGLRQTLVVRPDGELGARLRSVVGLTVRPVRWPFLHATARVGGCDLLHAHDGRAPGFTAIAARRYSLPYVVTRRIQRPPGRGSRWAYRDATALVGLSEGVAGGLRRATGRTDVRIIPSASSSLPVDPACVARLEERYEGRFLVVCPAQLVPGQKGQEHLIAAARALEEAGTPVHVLLLGRGGGEAFFRRLAAGLESVEFGGFVDNLGDYLAAADALVLPSLHEGLGSVLLDAFAAGLPVIASDIPGVQDVVRHGETGVLVPAADAGALAEALLRLREDPALRARLAQAGRETAGQYSPARMADRYLSLYRDCLA